MKIRAYLNDLENFRNVRRPIQFSEELWNSFYQLEVQIRCSKALHTAQKKLKRAKEAGKTADDLKPLEQQVETHQQTKDEVGNCPKKFILVADRVVGRPKVTHMMGQGGLPGLKAAFKYKRKIMAKEMEIGTKHGKKHLFELTDAALASEEDSDEEDSDEEDSDEEDSDDEEDSADVSNELEERSSQRHEASFVADSIAASTADGRRWTTMEEEQHKEEEQGEQEEEEEEEQQEEEPPRKRQRQAKGKKEGTKKRSRNTPV
ncbi:unnamed protein product [Calypogeia fissa]